MSRFRKFHCLFMVWIVRLM